MEKSKLICLDLDNTLVYSDKAHVYSYNKALVTLGLKKKSSKYLLSLFGMPHYKVIKKIAPRLDEKGLKRLGKIHDSIFIKEGVRYCKPIIGAGKALKGMRKLGYKLALLSNLSHKTILATLKTTGLDKNLLDIIIGNDEVKHSKPDPDMILKAERLAKSKAKYMIGDTIYDIIAGKRARVKTVSVLTGDHSKAKLKRYKPDFIVENITHVLTVIN